MKNSKLTQKSKDGMKKLSSKIKERQEEKKKEDKKDAKEKAKAGWNWLASRTKSALQKTVN